MVLMFRYKFISFCSEKKNNYRSSGNEKYKFYTFEICLCKLTEYISKILKGIN